MGFAKIAELWRLGGSLKSAPSECARSIRISYSVRERCGDTQIGQVIRKKERADREHFPLAIASFQKGDGGIGASGERGHADAGELALDFLNGHGGIGHPCLLQDIPRGRLDDGVVCFIGGGGAGKRNGNKAGKEKTHDLSNHAHILGFP